MTKIPLLEKNIIFCLLLSSSTRRSNSNKKTISQFRILLDYVFMYRLNMAEYCVLCGEKYEIISYVFFQTHV